LPTASWGFVNPSLILFAKIAARAVCRWSEFRHGHDEMARHSRSKVALCVTL
jgi:hypothetical protein